MLKSVKYVHLLKFNSQNSKMMHLSLFIEFKVTAALTLSMYQAASSTMVETSAELITEMITVLWYSTETLSMRTESQHGHVSADHRFIIIHNLQTGRVVYCCWPYGAFAFCSQMIITTCLLLTV